MSVGSEEASGGRWLLVRLLILLPSHRRWGRPAASGRRINGRQPKQVSVFGKRLFRIDDGDTAVIEMVIHSI
ncbi:MAG: hypothetical protein GF344_10170 [Chitinivibrionales bacterium]|nr:hypothetical protein [Chitinivibrionales bacterium]